MPVLQTAKKHFDADITRSRALHAHAPAAGTPALRDDILRAAVMMSVGASDAYFCDAYADLVSRSLRAKELQPAVAIPDRLNNLRIPVAAILREAKGGWRWRMAARELIEDESVLSLDKVRQLFNQFFDDSDRLLNRGTIESWLLAPGLPSRLFGVTPTAYRKLSGATKNTAQKSAMRQFEEHFESLFQRRHDCIHNCDRPKMAVQRIQDPYVTKAIDDIVYLVEGCHMRLRSSFAGYLERLGFNAITRNQVCA